MESPILGSGEVLVIRTRVTNTGLSSITNYEQDIPELGSLNFPLPVIIPPGVTIVTITRLYVPDEVGVYNYEIVDLCNAEIIDLYNCKTSEFV